jgi:hypothetical protein
MKRRGQWITPWLGPARATRTLSIAFYQGRLDDAHRWLADAWEGTTRDRSMRRRPRSGLSRTTPCRSPRSRSPASPHCGAARERAQHGNDGNSRRPRSSTSRGDRSVRNFVTVYLAWIRMVTGNLEEARESGRRIIELAERYRFDYFQLLGGQYKRLPEADRPCDVAELEVHGEGMNLVGHGAFRPTYLGIVARNHYYLGDADRALRTVEDAIDLTKTSGELVHQPDLLRLRAEINASAHPDRMDGWSRIWPPQWRSAWPRGLWSLHCGPPSTWHGYPTTTARRIGVTGSVPCSSGSHPIPRAPNSTRRWIFSESDAGHFDRSPTASDSATVATEHAPRFLPLPGRGPS